MKDLKEILYGVGIQRVHGSTSNKIARITFDSRDIQEGDVFVAIKGTASDGHDFIEDVIAKGCTSIVCERDVEIPKGITMVVTDSSSKSLAIMANNFYDEPSSKLTLIGITGTNGKTTIATLLYDLFKSLGYKTGLLSTVVNKIDERRVDSTHTTPDSISLNSLLSEMVDAGVTHCFMEVSSHAISQNRTTGLTFAGGAFTNITHDHLDYHKTFREYIDVKKRFFDGLSRDSFALTNLDDRNGTVMLQNTKAKQRSYAMKTMADYKVKVLENQFSGLVLTINEIELWTRLIGDFNAYNLLAVYAICIELGIDSTEALVALSKLESVQGRFEYVQSQSGITAIVDYAHTPDALKNVLSTIENIRTKNETVFTVVGCGGDRDKTKRPEMASIACEFSDKVIFTADNPRSEDPNNIIDEMLEGVDGSSFKKTLSIVDREQAIKTAISMAEANDIILVAGKGHEKYQEVKGIRHDFDDMETIKELFNKLNK